MATLIFKPTETCNSRCIYCEVVKKKSPGPRKMPFPTLELLFRRINEYLLAQPQEDMTVIWHGGEPLLLGPAYFERAAHYQAKHCPETASRIRHSLQSNLTLLTGEFLAPLRKLGIRSIGSSYDPIGDVRGLGKDRDWRGYNRRFLDAVCLLDAEGFDWAVIYVVTRRSLARPLELFNFLTNLAPRGGLIFNPVLVHGPGLEGIKVTPSEYASFLGAIFPAWWQQRADYGPIEPFFSLSQALLGDRRSLVCSDSGTCAQRYLAVLPDGHVSHCGRSGDWGLLDYGSIQEKSFAQIFADPQRALLLRRQAALPAAECRGCRFWELCHGGCPLDAWFATGSFTRKSDWCRARQELLEKHLEPIVLKEAACI